MHIQIYPYTKPNPKNEINRIKRNFSGAGGGGDGDGDGMSQVK